MQREELLEAVAKLKALRAKGVNEFFGQRIEAQIKQIILAYKMRGQGLDATLQTLEHFYREGVMGGLDQSSGDRDATLAAWRYQLTRLWDTVNPPDPSSMG